MEKLAIQELATDGLATSELPVNELAMDEVATDDTKFAVELPLVNDSCGNACSTDCVGCIDLNGDGRADYRRWSSTRLKSFLLCPRQFRYAYVDEIPAIPTAPLVFGRTIHEALCYVGEYQMRTRRLPKLPDVLVHFYASWGGAMHAEQPYFGASNPAPDQYRTMGREMLGSFLKDEANGVTPIAVELAFEVQVGEFVLSGIVDRVEQGDEGLVVVDFKSGARKPKQAALKDDLQFTIYALAMERMLGQKVERVFYYQLKDGTCIDVYPDEKDFARLTEEILPQVSNQVATALSRQEFAPCPGYWCYWCDYRELCRAENWLRWEGKIGEGKI